MTVTAVLGSWGTIQLLVSMTPVAVVGGSGWDGMKELSSTMPVTVRRLEGICVTTETARVVVIVMRAVEHPSSELTSLGIALGAITSEDGSG
jgi:hypothetical protein